MTARPPALPPTSLAALVGTGTDALPGLLHPLPRRGADALESRVRIRHPHYEPPVDVLLLFRCVDGLPSQATNDNEQLEIDAGIHHATVLHACAIIAGNAFERAALSRDRQGLEPILVPLDGVLDPGDYWLQMVDPSGASTSTASTRSSPYPIVASFSDWRFPHGRPLPGQWLAPHNPPAHELPASTLRHGITDRIKQQQPASRPCCVTGQRGPFESAHLVPQAMTEWFKSNMMGEYTESSIGSIHDDANRIPLRPDLHLLLDRQSIVIVPKPVRITANNPSQRDHALAIHVLEPKNMEIVALYHNISLQTYSDDVNTREYRNARSFMFARFAHSIFCLLQPFLQAAQRLVLVADADDQPPLEEKWMTPKELDDRARQTKASRSQSGSRKRRQPQQDEDGERETQRRRLALRSPVSEDPLENDALRWYNENLAPKHNDDDVVDPLENDVLRWYNENLAPDINADGLAAHNHRTQRGRSLWRKGHEHLRQLSGSSSPSSHSSACSR